MIEPFVILAILVAFGYAAGNVMDKLLLSNHIESAETMQFVGGLLAPLAALPVLLIGPITTYEPTLFALTIFTGFIFFAGGYLQMEATKLGEVSNMTLLLKTIPIFALILGAVFLSERLTVTEYGGFALIVTGAILVSLNTKSDGLPNIDFTLPNLLTIAAAFLFAVAFVLMRFLLESGVSVVNVFFWSDFGGFLLTPFLLYFTQVRQEFRDLLTKPMEKGVPLFVFSIFVYAAANITSTFALNEAPAALVTSLVSADALFVIVIVAFLVRLGFDEFEEPLTRHSIAVKVVAGILFTIGAFLVG